MVSVHLLRDYRERAWGIGGQCTLTEGLQRERAWGIGGQRTLTEGLQREREHGE